MLVDGRSTVDDSLGDKLPDAVSCSDLRLDGERGGEFIEDGMGSRCLWAGGVDGDFSVLPFVNDGDLDSDLLCMVECSLRDGVGFEVNREGVVGRGEAGLADEVTVDRLGVVFTVESGLRTAVKALSLGKDFMFACEVDARGGWIAEPSCWALWEVSRLLPGDAVSGRVMVKKASTRRLCSTFSRPVCEVSTRRSGTGARPGALTSRRSPSYEKDDDATEIVR